MRVFNFLTFISHQKAKTRRRFIFKFGTSLFVAFYFCVYLEIVIYLHFRILGDPHWTTWLGIA